MQWGIITTPLNGRWFQYPVSFNEVFSVVITSLAPVNFDNYTCVSYLWTDSTVTQAHIITTNHHIPSVYVLAIGQ